MRIKEKESVAGIIMEPDVIFVIANGTIAERGTHDKLLTTGGLYSQL